MAEKRIELASGVVRIRELEIRKKDIADFLEALPDEEREPSFIRALEVGVFCLERAQTSQDTEFVRRQVDSLLAQVETATQAIPGKVEEALIGKVGVEEGQVLAPIKSVVNDTSKILLDRVKEVKELLSQEVDPSKETTTLGKALRALKDMLDPKRTDSVQGVIEAAVSQVTTEEGALAKTVKTVVAASVKPLADEVSRLALEIRGKDAAAEALAQTAAKGVTYEEEVLSRLQGWAQTVGTQVEYVGGDNRPGDILVTLTSNALAGTQMKIVIEVRDRQSPKGRKQINDDLVAAMAERAATSAVYLSRNVEGLAKEIGEWAEGQAERGSWVACSDAHLVTSIRFLVAQERLKEMSLKSPEVDAVSIVTQIQRVRTALDRVKNMNRHLGDVKSGADSIRVEAEGLRDEIRDALSNIEEAIRTRESKAQETDAA